MLNRTSRAFFPKNNTFRRFSQGRSFFLERNRTGMLLVQKSRASQLEMMTLVDPYNNLISSCTPLAGTNKFFMTVKNGKDRGQMEKAMEKLKRLSLRHWIVHKNINNSLSLNQTNDMVNVYVANLHPELTKKEFNNFLKPYMNISTIEMPFDQQNMCRGK